MELAKVTSKGQITIPLMIRNKLQLKQATRFSLKKAEARSILQTLLKLLYQMFRNKCREKQKKPVSRPKTMSSLISRN